MTTQFRFYSTNFPNEKSMVNFIFTKHHENCFECYLPDYDVSAIMPFQLATQKTSLKNKHVNTLAPLLKPFIGTVEEISDDNTIIISMAFIDKKSDDYKFFEETNQKNKVLLSCVKKYAIKNNYNFNKYWENYFYPLDSKKEELSLFDYIIENMNDIHQEGNIDKFLLDLIKDITVKNTNPITKFKMVSSNGIKLIKDSIYKALIDTNMQKTLVINLETPPIYNISSKDYSINEEHHTLFLEKLISDSTNTSGLFISKNI
jgi:hypothetical protein